MAQPEDGEVQEPENSTVDDWFGQNVARDQDTADEVADDAETEEEAAAAFNVAADGKERFDKGHKRPSGVEAKGDEVGRDAPR